MTLAAPMARTTPPAPHGTMSSPLRSGPANIAAASIHPEAALPVVSSAVVSDRSGTTAKCTGRVMLTATAASAASTATTGYAKSATSAAPQARNVIACSP
jgi:hypothetical protein